MEIRSHSSVDEISEWDAIRPNCPMYMAAWWLRHCERLFADVLQPTYLTAHHDGTIVAGTVCWTLPRPQIVLPPLEPTRLFSTWRAEGVEHTRTTELPFPEDELYPCTLVGSPVGQRGQLVLRPGLDAETQRLALSALYTAAEDVARRAGAKLVIAPYLDTEDAQLLKAALGSRAFLTYAAGDCYLPLAGLSSFDDYMAGFKSHYRRPIRQDIAKFAEAGMRCEVRRPSEVLDEACDVLIGSAGRHGWSIEAERVRMMRKDLELLAAHCDDRTMLYCAYHDQQIVGVANVGIHEGRSYARSVGMLLDWRKRGSLYFNVLYYAPIRHALDLGLSEIHYAAGSLQAKYMRGCRQRALWNAVTPLSPWSDEILKAANRGGETLLATDIAILSSVMSPEKIEIALDLPRTRAIQP